MIDLHPFLQKYYQDNKQPILVACSTGPDSMYLVHALLVSSFRARIVLLYFHHHLRPDADDEVRFLKTFCKKHTIPYQIGHADIPTLQKNMPSVSLETLARTKRYEFFENMRIYYQTSYTLAAHHANDRIETFFFHLLRGTKLTGLINMTEKSGPILRPLLSLTKKEILRSMHDNAFQYMVDASNSDTIFARNRIRKNIFPEFSHINAHWEKNIENFIHYAEELQIFLQTQVEYFLQKNDWFFLVNDFAKESVFLQKEILRFLYVRANGSSMWLSEANLKEMLKFVFSPYGGTVFMLGKVRFEKKSGKVRYTQK